HPNGDTRWARIEIRPFIETGSSEVSSLTLTNEDITEQVLTATENRRSSDRLSAIARSDIHGIYYFKLDGSIHEPNTAFLKLCGLDMYEFEQHAPKEHDLTPSEWQEQDAKALHHLLETGLPTTFLKEIVRTDNQLIPVCVTLSLLKDDIYDGI